jgi:hypothetical protein
LTPLSLRNSATPLAAWRPTSRPPPSAERQRTAAPATAKLPKPPEEGDVELLYAKLQEDLRHLNDGEMVTTVIGTDAWQSTVGARCRALDAAADPRRAYTAEECEKALLFQRLLGKRACAAARKELAGAIGAYTRTTLGFDRPRDHVACAPSRCESLTPAT